MNRECEGWVWVYTDSFGEKYLLLELSEGRTQRMVRETESLFGFGQEYHASES